MREEPGGRDAANSRQTPAAPNADSGGKRPEVDCSRFLKPGLNMRDPEIRARVADVADAVAWTRREGECWEYVIRRCAKLVSANRRFSFKTVIGELRYQCPPRLLTEGHHVPSKYETILGRIACAQVPGMRKLVQMGRSKYDEVLNDRLSR